MGHANHGEQKSNVPSIVIGAIVFLLIGYLISRDTEGFFAVTHQYFQLTRSDVLLIPIGSALFLVFWTVMNKVLWAPYLKLLEAREDKTIGARARAQKGQLEADTLQSDYEQQLMTTRASAMREKLAVLTDAKKRAQSILDAATRDAQEYVLKQRSELKQKEGELRKETFATAEEMSDLVVERLKQPPAVPSKQSGEHR